MPHPVLEELQLNKVFKEITDNLENMTPIELITLMGALYGFSVKYPTKIREIDRFIKKVEIAFYRR